MTAKDLKNALLQEAVQGKLVPQIAAEGNARDLLEEIRKEKLSHGFANSYGICGEKGKKSKSSDLRSKSQIRVTKKELPEIAEDEIPFDIPESWCWCRLGEICQNVNYGTSAKSQSTGIVPVLRMGNITKDGKLSFDNLVYTSDKTEIETYKLNSGDILFNRTNSAEWVGKTTVYKGERPAIFAGYIIRYTPIIVDSDYVNIVMNTSYQKKWCSEVKTNGVQQCNINAQNLMKFIFPLPPLAEQKRIVAAIEKFMPLIEEYGKKETQLKAINEKIGKLTKKAILQEAVQGKLVPQIASEGNARDLLEKIRKEILSHGFANSYGICGEKCKKSKSSDLRSKSQIRVTKKELPEITEDEIPFDIPESWCWCRLGEIVPFGVCQNAEPQEINDEDWILDLEDIEKDSGKILSFKTKKEVDSKSTKHIFKKGFVLYSKLRPYLNKCVIAPKDGFCTSEILPLDFGDMIYNKYAQLYLMSPFFVDYTNSLSFGVKMPRLGTEDGRKALFPLPPLAEQKRIVAAIEKMLPLCEKLGE